MAEALTKREQNSLSLFREASRCFPLAHGWASGKTVRTAGVFWLRIVRLGSVMNNHRTFCVLLVEDEPFDARLMQRASKYSGFPLDLDGVADGCACLEFLFRKVHRFRNFPRPDPPLTRQKRTALEHAHE